MRKPVPGHRHFECPDCFNKWEEVSRDCLSPSISSCPKCSSESPPVKFIIDNALKTDKSGNLIT